MKKCTECEHFRIMYEPLRICGSSKLIIDSGKLICSKYDLVCDYITKQQIGKLKCVE